MNPTTQIKYKNTYICQVCKKKYGSDYKTPSICLECLRKIRMPLGGAAIKLTRKNK